MLITTLSEIRHALGSMICRASNSGCTLTQEINGVSVTAIPYKKQAGAHFQAYNQDIGRKVLAQSLLGELSKQSQEQA